MSEYEQFDPFIKHPEISEQDFHPISTETKSALINKIEELVSFAPEMSDPKAPPPYEMKLRVPGDDDLEVLVDFIPEKFDLKNVPFATCVLTESVPGKPFAVSTTYRFIRTPESIELEKAETTIALDEQGNQVDDYDPSKIELGPSVEESIIKELTKSVDAQRKVDQQERAMGMGFVDEKEAQELLKLISESEPI
jgi:hypothetical protein